MLPRADIYLSRDGSVLAGPFLIKDGSDFHLVHVVHSARFEPAPMYSTFLSENLPDWSTLPPFVKVKCPPTFQLLNKIPTQRHTAPPPVDDNKLPSPVIGCCRGKT